MPDPLGVGIVGVPGLEPLHEPGRGLVDVLEIEPETTWPCPPGEWAPERLAAETARRVAGRGQAVLVHSVGFGLGAGRSPAPLFLDTLARTVRLVGAPWVSAHLAVTHAEIGGALTQASFMMPPLQTPAGLRAAVASVREFAEAMPVPVALENGTRYLAAQPGEWDDGEFVARVLEETGCGLLLDLHNLFANERNGRQPAREFLRSLPLDRVWEIHLGGGFEFEGFWLDAHSGVVPEEVFALADELVPQCPALGAIVFELFPSFLPRFGLAGVEAQLLRAREVWDARFEPGAPAPLPPRLGPPGRTEPEVAVESWERALVGLATGSAPGSALERRLSADPSIELVRRMIWRFRAGAISTALPALTRLLLLAEGPDLLESLFDDYFAAQRPLGYASLECRAFLDWLAARELEIPQLEAVAAYELGRLRSALEGRPQLVQFDCDPRPIFEALADDRLPGEVPAGRYELEVTAA